MRHRILAVQPQALAGMFLVLLLVLPVSAEDRGIKFDREADFSNYRLYDWVVESKARPQGTPLALGGAADTRIREAIDRRLNKKGFKVAADAEADFLVTYDGALEPVTDIEGRRRQLSSGVAWVVEGDINSYSRGTLVITIRDRATGEVVWTGWTTESIKGAEASEKQIDRAVKKILRRFPPHHR